MAERTPRNAEDLFSVYQAMYQAMFAAPFAGARWGLGIGKEQEVAEVGWRGYDVWVRMASASIDELYRNPLFGDLVAHSLDELLRWQRLSMALAGVAFAGLWPAVGLPTAAAVQGLSEQLRSIDIHLKAQEAQLQSLREELRSLAAGPPSLGEKARAHRQPGCALEGGADKNQWTPDDHRNCDLRIKDQPLRRGAEYAVTVQPAALLLDGGGHSLSGGAAERLD
jgi:hypothetical protein